MRRKPRRSASLKRTLNERRRELQGEIDGHLRNVRTDQADSGRDDLDMSDATIRRDLEQTLLQMRVEALARVDEALVRFDDGDYGSCVACGGEIADQRLQALPFAVRCRACEQAREDAPNRARPFDQPAGTLPSFTDMLFS